MATTVRTLLADDVATRKRTFSAVRDSQMAWIPAGTFLMGSNDFYPEEHPVHRVGVDGFWIDRAPVTTVDFAEFVSETGYATVAERERDPGVYPAASGASLAAGGMVFRQPSNPIELDSSATWWEYVPGANWRQPSGDSQSPVALHAHPVVQIAYEDATAYAEWAGKALPTEAEWEYAARGGLPQSIFTWGDVDMPNGQSMANTWQGSFPFQNLKHDGFAETSPVGAFPANGYGLYDMAGNVWEWTADWYRAPHSSSALSPSSVWLNPRGGTPDESFALHDSRHAFPRKVVKGGSYLCSPNHNFRYRPAARQGESIDTASCDLGFRCAMRPADVFRESGTTSRK